MGEGKTGFGPVPHPTVLADLRSRGYHAFNFVDLCILEANMSRLGVGRSRLGAMVLGLAVVISA